MATQQSTDEQIKAEAREQLAGKAKVEAYGGNPLTPPKK
jgi:hypothetical protein